MQRESEAFAHTGDQVRASCFFCELDPVEDSFDYSFRQILLAGVVVGSKLHSSRENHIQSAQAAMIHPLIARNNDAVNVLQTVWLDRPRRKSGRLTRDQARLLRGAARKVRAFRGNLAAQMKQTVFNSNKSAAGQYSSVMPEQSSDVACSRAASSLGP